MASFPAEVLGKAQEMATKSEEARRLFNLPETEVLIQDYFCTNNRTIPIKGRLYLTLNFACFYSALPEINEKIPFRKVQGIEKVRLAGIDIKTDTGDFKFGSFMHRYECSVLLTHLWKFPPSYTVYNTIESNNNDGSKSSQSMKRDSLDNPPSNGGGGGGFGRSNRDTSQQPKVNANENPFQSNSMSSQQQVKVEVDTRITKEALRVVKDTQTLAAATLNELSYQGELIDMIDRDMDTIMNNTDKANRHLRGIESFPGAVANKFGSAPKGKEKETIDRQVKVASLQLPDAEFPICLKLPNDSLELSTLAFTVEKFSVKNEKNQPIKEYSWTYDKVAEIKIRARHLHADIIFLDPKALRFRFMSSAIQPIINELSIRTGKLQELLVEFEPGTKKFQFGFILDSRNAKILAQNAGDAGSFRRFNGAAAPSVDAKIVSPQYQAAVQEQDDDLDDIAIAVGEIGNMAIAMGREADRQTDDLKRLNKKADLANEKLHFTNNRINQLL